MERCLTKQLIAWKDNPEKKPLILKGVRQCGKTWLLKEFGEEYYDDTAYFSFEGNDPLHARFAGDFDVRRIITELGVYRKKNIEPGKTLIIFDEIQFCGRALSSLKYFCEDAPEYHIVCAGSLLGLALSGPLSFPVGKVDFQTLRPLSFYEFLLANGEALLCKHLEKFPVEEPVPELFAGMLERYVRTYYITGGMPEAVANWIANHDIEKLEAVHRKILDSYELDFAKHAPTGEFPKLRAVWHSIPAQLAKENSKFIFSQVKKGQRAKDLEDALEWLLGAGLVYRVTKVEKPFMPLSSYADSSFFKLYMADVGLLRTMAALPAEAVLGQIDVYKEFKGALTENYVLTELVNLYNEPPFFWRSNNTAEVDFIIQHKLDIIPIEVKSERNTKAKSLAEYRKKYEPRWAVKTSMSNGANTFCEGEKSAVLNVPLYMLWMLKSLLADKGNTP
ncbi:ATP-binding protein [Treponema primitia]|uniref:ATP-binding protein n=1 Tax=Treponema primitia TaxID=88058 RepID=UPI0002554C31|nr:ATP-binding protein [Treponema primitia]